MREFGSIGNTEGGRVVSLARKLLLKGGALESTADGREIIDRAALSATLEQYISSMLPESERPPFLPAAAVRELLRNADNAFNKGTGGDSPSNFTDDELYSLEAIIEVTGRPASRYSDFRVQLPPSDLGENDRWRVLIAIERSKIERVSASVGRIMIAGNTGMENIGTGWRLGNDLIVTNRHVGLQLIEHPDAIPVVLTLDAAKRPSIDFAATDNPTSTKRFDIGSVVYCAAEEYVDISVLKVNSGVADLPPALKLDWDQESLGREISGNNEEPTQFKGREVYVVGHPYRSRRSSAITSVFGVADGLKRWSPGLVVGLDQSEPIFEHDCSTLGGNSGSCVFTAEGHAVAGIHMGATGVNDETDRGTANLAVALSRLGAHRAAEILRDGVI